MQKISVSLRSNGLCLLICLVAGFEAQGQTCPCTPALDFIRGKTELNYAGFSAKVTAATRAAYDSFTLEIKTKTDTAQSIKACRLLCSEWLNWFKDRHLQVAPDLLAAPRRPDSDFAFTALDSQTLLFRLPTMGGNYLSLIDSTIKSHKQDLESHPFLIIDCRGNAGGSLNAWYALKPYLYTGPVISDGMLQWASPDNAQHLLNSIKPKMPKAQQKYLRKLAKEMKKKPGTFVGTMNARREQLKTVLPNPQKVALLVNKRCASSCEFLVLWAKQSKKVTVMGEQTAGVADYGGMNTLSVPCLNWLLGYPTARSNRVPDGRGIDNVGIAPDVKLDEQTKDWVEFARQWFEQR